MIEVKNLCKVYEDSSGNVHALKNVSFTLPSKGMVFIVGKSGCGKTTLLNIIGGLDNLTSGDVLINKRPLSSFSINDLDNYRNSTVGFVFQDFCLIDRMSVKDNIKMSLEFQDSNKDVDYNKLLKRFGLEGLGKRKPTQLSAGQKQRVAIARAIIKDPDILLADEPTGNVDEKTSTQILNILKEISKERLVVVISHNNEEAYQYGDRIIEMFDGEIVSDKSINNYSSEKLLVNNKEVILPGHGILGDTDLEIINNVIQKGRGNIKISQSPELFQKEEVQKTDEELELKKTKMRTSTKLKFASFFFKKKIVFNIFIVLLITFCTSVFSIVEILGFVKNNYEFNRMIQEREHDQLVIRPDNMNYIYSIDEDIINQSCTEYGVDYNLIYNISIPAIPSSSSSSAGLLSTQRSNYSCKNLIKNGYCIETFGVMPLTEGKLNEFFPDYEILAGEIEKGGSGVIITDYFADSILKLNHQKYSSYQDIIDGGYIENRAKVDAIIKTDVYERYPNLYDKWNSTYKKDPTVSYILASFYALSFSLNSNFKNSFLEEYKTFDTPFIHIPSYHFLNTAGLQVKGNYGGFYFLDDLASDEIHMNYLTYNSYFGGKYNTKNLDTFPGDVMSVTFTTSLGDVFYTKEFKVTKLFAKTHYYDNYRLSKEVYDEIFNNMIFPYSVSLDSKTGRIYDLAHYLEKDLEDGYYSPSLETHMMYSTVELFSAFKEVFRFLSYLLIGAIALIILLNANTIIKHNVYEIGLMKAFGAKTRDLVFMFSLQMFFSSLMVCILLYTSSEIFINLADVLLKNGIASYNPSGKNYLTFHTFVFLDGYFYINISLIALATITSVIIPILAIRKIKPLTIIRTRN